jgi:hypothetical protein
VNKLCEPLSLRREPIRLDSVAFNGTQRESVPAPSFDFADTRSGDSKQVESSIIVVEVDWIPLVIKSCPCSLWHCDHIALHNWINM